MTLPKFLTTAQLAETVTRFGTDETRVEEES